MGVLVAVAARSIVPLFAGLTTILGCAKLALETYRGYEEFLREKRQKEKNATSD